MSRKFWTKEEEEFLRVNYKTMAHEEMAEKLDRTKNSITVRCMRLGLIGPKLWNEEAENFLRENYLTMPYEEIASILGRSKKAIREKCKSLKFYRASPWTKEQDNFLRANYLILRFKEIGKQINRSESAVSSRCKLLGIASIKRWTKEEDEFIRTNHRIMSDLEISLKLSRSELAIKMRRCKLGFPCDPKSPGIESGTRFEMLEVICKSKKIGRRGEVFYTCKCDCGTVRDVLGWKLRNGSVRSCGCLWITCVRSRSRKAIGEAGYNLLEGTYRRSAKERAMEFGLITGEFRFLVSQNCDWCNRKPKSWNHLYGKDGIRHKTKHNSTSDEWAKQQWINVNGIDRIDSNKGYTTDNCVPCCTPCNRMKLDMSKEEYQGNIKRNFIHQLERGDFDEDINLFNRLKAYLKVKS